MHSNFAGGALDAQSLIPPRQMKKKVAVSIVTPGVSIVLISRFAAHLASCATFANGDFFAIALIFPPNRR